ncbi:MAG: hypothetical protein IAE94_09560 [Chthoniobacterales bacterium]|nr:hypothetical protein [Chthoniobacterales bacterium]
MKTIIKPSKQTEEIINLAKALNGAMDRMTYLAIAIEQEQYEESASQSSIRGWLDEMASEFEAIKQENMEYAL